MEHVKHQIFNDLAERLGNLLQYVGKPVNSVNFISPFKNIEEMNFTYIFQYDYNDLID